MCLAPDNKGYLVHTNETLRSVTNTMNTAIWTLDNHTTNNTKMNKQTQVSDKSDVRKNI